MRVSIQKRGGGYRKRTRELDTGIAQETARELDGRERERERKKDRGREMGERDKWKGKVFAAASAVSIVCGMPRLPHGHHLQKSPPTELVKPM